MKKLLALTLVLGLAGIASATVSLSVDKTQIAVGESALLTVSSDDTGSYGGWLGIDAGPGDIGLLVINPNAGADASSDGSTPGWWFFEAKSFNPEAPIVAGEHFTVPVTGTAEGMIDIGLYDFAGVNIVDSARVEVIPEPMTLGLLGLGGLFLRRRK